jgi:gas vesicle protein
MANSNFETLKRGGEAIDEVAEQTGHQAGGMVQQAKAVAADAYDSAAGMAQDAIAAAKTRTQDAISAAKTHSSDLDDVLAEQAVQHPKAMLALGIGFGFLLGVLFASTRGGSTSRW